VWGLGVEYGTLGGKQQRLTLRVLGNLVEVGGREGVLAGLDPCDGDDRAAALEGVEAPLRQSLKRQH
jgi:hypothetical protein